VQVQDPCVVCCVVEAGAGGPEWDLPVLEAGHCTGAAVFGNEGVVAVDIAAVVDKSAVENVAVVEMVAAVAVAFVGTAFQIHIVRPLVIHEHLLDVQSGDHQPGAAGAAVVAVSDWWRI